MTRRIHNFALTAACLMAGLIPATRGAIASETLSLGPVEDTFSRAALPDATYGTGGALHVSGATATNEGGMAQGLADSWMRFDTAATVASFDAIFGAGNWTLESAVLSVRENSTPTSSVFTRGVGDFSVAWIANDNWSQGTGASSSPGTATGNEIGWTHGQSLLSGSDRGLGVFQNAGNNTRQNFSLSLDGDFVADLLAGGSTTLRLASASDGIGFTFNSSNNGNPNNRPQLILTAVPEPASAVLLLGLAVPMLYRRR